MKTKSIANTEFTITNTKLNKYYRNLIIKYKISSELQANNFKCITEKLAFLGHIVCLNLNRNIL